jgi:hypothetical protein
MLQYHICSRSRQAGPPILSTYNLCNWHVAALGWAVSAVGATFISGNCFIASFNYLSSLLTIYFSAPLFQCAEFWYDLHGLVASCFKSLLSLTQSGLNLVREATHMSFMTYLYFSHMHGPKLAQTLISLGSLILSNYYLLLYTYVYNLGVKQFYSS